MSNTSSTTHVTLETLSADKNCTEFYSKYFSKLFSRRFSLWFINAGVSANQITLLMLIAGLCAALCFVSSSILLNIFGCLLLLLINILDTSDGEVARVTQTCSPWGVILDKLSHVITNQTLFFCLGYHYYVQTTSFAFLIFGFLLGCVVTIDDFAKEIFLTTKQTSSEQRKTEKLSLSFDRSSLLQTVLHITTSSVAFYHLFPLAFVLDLGLGVFRDPGVTTFSLALLYLCYFSAASLAKMAIRIRRIRKAF